MKNLYRKKIKKAIAFLRKTIILEQEILKSRLLRILYKMTEKDFTRDRKLTFEIMIILMLQKWIKSLQLKLNELLSKLWTMATNSAYSQAKNKVSYEVFMYLDKSTIIDRYYDIKENEAWFETWKWFRILATDGSQIRLPDEEEITKKYWKTKIKNGSWEQWEYTHWLLSILYDPLNNLALNSILEEWKYSERALAIQHILNLESYKNPANIDLMLYDRWYYSSFLFAILLAYNKEYVCRIQNNSCKEVNELFEKDCKINSKIVTLTVINKEVDYMNDYWIKINKTLEKTIKVRFVRIILSTWEIEVLATSLLDEEKYTNEDFKELYHKRWWIEVYYNVLKNRLWLENFSWKNENSVLQDLYSSIFLSNFETIATRPSNLELELKSNTKKLKNKQKVNKQVSFNIIKNQVLELFLSNKPISEIMMQMMILFQTNPTQERIWRTSKRWKTSASKALYHHKRKKKSCF